MLKLYGSNRLEAAKQNHGFTVNSLKEVLFAEKLKL